MLTQAETVRISLETDILNGSLSPGTLLGEAGIAERFGVSRTPVREALAHLVQAGLVKKEARRCATVARVDLASCRPMFEAIGELEGLSARLAAERMSAQEKRNLADLHERADSLLASGNADDYAEIGREFHFTILQGAKNPTLTQITNTLATRLIPFRRYQIRAPGQLKKNQADHDLILKAILNSDRELSFSLMRAHSADQDATLIRMIEGAGALEGMHGSTLKMASIASLIDRHG